MNNTMGTQIWFTDYKNRIVAVNNKKITAIASIFLVIGSAIITQGAKRIYGAEYLLTENLDALFLPIWTSCLTIIIFGLFSGMHLTRKDLSVLLIAWAARVIYIYLMEVHIINFTIVQDDITIVLTAQKYFIGDFSSYYTRMPFLLNYEWQIFGPSEYLSSLLGEFLTLVAVFYMLRFLDMFRINGKIRTVLIAVVSLSPMTLLLSSVPVREPIYFLCTITSLYYFVRFSSRHRMRDLILSLVITLPMVWLHVGNIIVPAVYYMVIFFRIRKGKADEGIRKILLLFVAVFAVFVFVNKGSSEYLVYGGGVSGIINGLIQRYSNYYYGQIDAGSRYLTWMPVIATPLQLILFTPLKMIYLLMSPMIWNVRGIKDLALLITDSLVFAAALAMPFSIRNNCCKLRRKLKYIDGATHTTVVTIIWLMIAFMIGYGLFTFNFGTAYRHRNCLLPVVCLLFAINHNLRRMSRQGMKIN